MTSVKRKKNVCHSVEVVECIMDTMECSKQRCFCDWHVTDIKFWIIPLIISLDCSWISYS